MDLNVCNKHKISVDFQRVMTQVDETTDENHESERKISSRNLEA